MKLILAAGMATNAPAFTRVELWIALLAVMAILAAYVASQFVIHIRTSEVTVSTNLA